MRIEKVHLRTPAPSSRSPSPARRHDQTLPRSSALRTPRVMVSRINKIDPTRRTSKQGQGTGHEKEEEEINVAPVDQSLIGGWREEEKAMPLKKRRTIIFEANGSILGRGKKVNVDVEKEREEEEEYSRCKRTDGKKWRCNKRRVEDYSWCEHHLQTSNGRLRSENLMKKPVTDDDDDDSEKKKKKKKKKKKTKKKEEEEAVKEKEDGGGDEGCVTKRENDDRKTKRKVKKKVKARSIKSLLRATVPLSPLNLENY